MMSRALIRRHFSTAVATPTFVPVSLKQLPYELGGLEPVISGLLLDYHYSKHHRTYVNNLNGVLEKQLEAVFKGDLKTSIALESKVRFNGGGHYNHEFFWDSLCPMKDSALPEQDTVLFKRLTQSFGSIEKFISIFSTQTAGIMGSGWGWLVYNKKTGLLTLRLTKD